MKTKYFIYALIVGFALRIVMTALRAYLLLDLQMDLFTHALLSGIPGLIMTLSFIGLLIKIYRYPNKEDFLNS